MALLIGGAVLASPATQTDPFQTFVFDARADLELLADSLLGAGQRPTTWTGNLDLQSATMVADLWFDNEQLADAVFGPGQRPPSWIGPTLALADILARNVRHDLELSADQHFGVNTRPQEWRGAEALLRCDRTLINTVNVLRRFYNIQPTTVESALNYCQTLGTEVDDALVNLLFGTQDAQGVLPNPVLLTEAVRGDLERLADELLGLALRPQNYRGNRDAGSATFFGDLYLDLELLANDRLGANVRPDGWSYSVAVSPGLSYLILRYNLELLADATLPGPRPTGWQGADPLERCAPQLRGLVFITQENYNLSIAAIDPFAGDYCAQVSAAANGIVENPPVLDVVEEGERLLSVSDWAFAYLDVAATQYMGVMPAGTPFRAVYRNFGESTMMFVSGDDFALYIDQRFTNLPVTTFNSLPTLEGVVPLTYCDARWCNGPGPTPTPTGSGPLIQLLLETTPVAPPDTGQLSATKQLVSWNYIRVTYVQDNPTARTAQVALEICAQPAQTATACEPVESVFDNRTGTPRPVLSQFNGLNVYEFVYGYTANMVIEGATRYSNDIWISDPTIR